MTARIDAGDAMILPTLRALIEGPRALVTTVTLPVFVAIPAPILPSVASAHHAIILPTLRALIEGPRALVTTVTLPVFVAIPAPILPSVASAHLGI